MKQLIILLTLFFSTSLLAQDGESVTIRDLESWGSLNLKYNITKKWTIGLEQQFRFGNNSTEINDYITELSTSYDFTKHFFGGLGFRYLGKHDRVGNIQGFENYFRFNVDVGVKHDLKRFNFKYRLRFQVRDQIGVSAEEGDYLKNNLRLKVGVGYNIKKWKLDPEVSSEIFTRFQKEEQNGFSNFRFTAGTKYKTKSFGTFGLFYRVEIELNEVYPKTTHIIGLKYTYTIKNKKKKNKKKEDEVKWH